MSAQVKHTHVSTNDDDLKLYITDTIERLNLLVQRLERFSEDRSGQSGAPADTAGDVDQGPGKQAAP